MAENVTSPSSFGELLKYAGRSTSATQPRRNSVYYFENTVFLVEGQLFKVPRHMFQINSAVFLGMFLLPIGKDATHAEGTSDDNPIRLPAQVTSIDFQRLLAFLYPLTIQYQNFMVKWGYDEWMSILKLAAMWEMIVIRMMAVEKLSAMDRFPSPLVKIECGRKYDFSSWVRAGFSTLVTRPEPLSESEGLELGLRDALRCAAAREQYIRLRGSANVVRFDNAGGLPLESILDELLGKDVPKNDAAETQTRLFPLLQPRTN